MNYSPLVQIGLIIVFGTAAQWIAWRIKKPSILLLISAGIAAGPIFHIIEPEKVFGAVLFPAVTAAVAVIMFEGGLGLRFSELEGTGAVVARLVTIGPLIGWLLTAFAARFIVGMSLPLSILTGALLVVTGPTVIIPLLEQVRPRGPAAAVLRWEGIVIDPIGALMALLVFEGVFSDSHPHSPATLLISGILRTSISGVIFAAAGGLFAVLVFKRNLVPDHLQNPVTLALVAAVYVAADSFQPESGLFAVTIMGMILANQNWVNVRSIVEFKETLRTLLLGALFIVLSARLHLHEITSNLLREVLFTLVLIVVIRPVVVYLSTLHSSLTRNERLYVALVAPRGIVAASVSSVLAIRLVQAGHADAEMLVPVVFVVVMGTVLVYGLAAAPLAKWLGLNTVRQGVLILGAHRWARELAGTLKDNGVQVALADSNPLNVRRARAAGLTAYTVNFLSHQERQLLDLQGVAHLVCVTPNDEVNALACLHMRDLLDRHHVYQLRPVGIDTASQAPNDHLRGQYLFAGGCDYHTLDEAVNRGASFEVAHLSVEVTLEQELQRKGNDALVLCTISPEMDVNFNTPESGIHGVSGHLVVLLAPFKAEEDAPVS